LEIKIEAEAQSCLGELSSTLLLEAYREIVKLKDDPLRGGELGNHPETGDLTGCRKIYFNGTKHRIIYQVLPSEQRPRTVRVLAVGRRANLLVYHTAARQLGRTPGVDAPEK
jgi:hypothetical protein